MEKQNSGMMHAGIKKVTSLFLAVSLIVTSAISGTINVHASDTLPYLGESAKGTNQAYGHGYRTVDLKNWTPETDPYSQFMRARIPLQTRNGAFSATQANKKLNSDTQMFTLAGDYGNAFFDSYQYTNEFSQYLFNYWQYTDYYGSWHGMPTEDVPESMYVSERGVSDAWKNRKFEFGIINMPNPGYTNAAHKNGVKSIGCIFLPRTGQNHAEMMTQDEQGKYPYADQLAKMCKWYGFDGYFINQEESIPSTDVPKYKEFMKQMRDQGIYIQWYDSVTAPEGGVSYQNEFNDANSSFVKDTKLGQVSDSIFLNYWWSKDKLTNSANLAKSLNLNPLTTVFAGIEAGGGRWGQPYDLRNNLDANGQPMNAIASLGAEFVHDGLDEDLDGGANNNIEMRREKDDYQWMAFQRERMWWTGMTQDPTTAQDKRRDASYANASIGVKTGDKWDGVSAYIAERSVIKGDTFVTNFNTGHGLEYVNNGTVSNSHEWSNIVIQDILPTWQWWQDTTGTKMTVDFDYGTKYKKTLADKTAGKFDYDLVGAYNGGSSLVISGKMDADNFLHLYKTNLDVNAASKMDITFKKTSSDTVAMKLGVIFADDPTKVVKLDIANTTAKSDNWVTSSVDLSNYAGEKIVAYGLAFTETSDKYQMNIGQMKYTSKAAVKPAAPTNFKIAKAYSTSAKEMTLTWDIASYDDIKQYNVYAVINGKEIYMGGTYDSTFYIKSLYDAAGPVSIKLKAVSADGTESDAATATYDYSKAVSNVTVTPTQTSLNVTFIAPEGVTLGTTDVSVAKEYSADTTTTFSATSANGVATVSVPVSVKDGSRYTMELTPKDASGKVLETVTYDGKFIDKSADTYTGKVSNGMLMMPESKDWYKMYVTPVTDGVDGDVQTVTRAVDAMPSIDHTVDSVKVVLEDYAGNKSSAVTVPNAMAVSITPSTASVQVTQTQQFTAKVKNYVSDSTVTWSVKGAKSTATTIQDGLLTIGTDETAGSIQVVATSKENTSIAATADVTVIPAVAINPSNGSVYKGETQQFSILNLGVTQQASDYNWSIKAAWGGLQAGTTITQDGLLTVDPNESAYSITVTATNKANSNLVYKASVNVEATLAISTTSYDSYIGEDVTFQVSYKGVDGAAADYNWKVESGTNGVTKSSNTTITDGVLKIGPDEKTSPLIVTATKKDNANITATYTCYPSNPIDISGSSSVMQDENATFTASIKYTPADSTMITWKVEDAKSTGTKISADGVLTVAADETAVSVTVRAISKDNPLISSTMTVTITAKPGIPEGCVSANTTILGASGNGNAGETVDKALDTDEATKWCVPSAKTGWLAIDLGKEYSINRWRTVQGEKGDGAPGFNTPKFALEVLKDKNATAANLKDSAYLANKDNWTEVEFVDNSKNLKMVVDNIISNPVTGRYFRLRIDDSTSNQYTAIRIHEFQLYGQAAMTKYNVKVAAATNGTITADKTTAAAGEKITLTVKPNDGYVIDSVKMNDTAVTSENGVYSFTMPAAEAAVAVTFKAAPVAKHAVTVSVSTNGTVTADKTTAATGEVVTLAVKPDNGYTLDTIKMNGTALEAVNGTYSFVMPEGEATLTAAFKALKYNVKATAAANGSVTPDKASAAAGEKVTLTVKADTGYAVDTVKVNGTSVTQVNSVYSFVMPAANAEVTATFKSTTPAITSKLAETTQGVSLEGQNGVTFNKNTKLVVQESKKVIPATNGQKGIKLFDISLILNGSKIEPDGKVKVTIQLPAECAKYKNLGIVYLDDNNVVHPIQSTVNGETISFVAEHFSLYGIVGTPASSTPENNTVTPVNNNSQNNNTTTPTNANTNNSSAKSPETGDTTTPILPVMAAFVACIGLVCTRKKKISIHQ